MKKQIVLMVLALGVLGLIAALVRWSGAGSGATPIEGTIAADGGDSSSSSNALQSRSEAQPAIRNRTSGDAAAPVSAPDPSPALPGGEELEILAVAKRDGKPVAGAEILHAELDEEAGDSLWKWLRDSELERRIEAHAVRSVCDGEGKARIPKPAESAIVIARAGELWGTSSFDARSESPVRVELVADADLAALVVDSSGRPVGGARVALRLSGGNWFHDAMSAASHEGDGIAVLRHAGYTIRSQQHNGDWTWHVALGAVLQTPVEVAIDAAKLPAEPIRLVLPATGECEVRVLDTGGGPFEGDLEVTLRVLGRDESLDEFGAQNGESGFALHELQRGVALFRHVEPGRAFEATAQRHGSNQRHRARGLGPAAAGQRAVITLRIGERSPVIAGRALDASGAVLVERPLRSRIESEDAPGHVEYTWAMKTDAAGRFAVDVSEELEGQGARALTVWTFDAGGGEQASATKLLPELGPGRRDLGDFVLQTSPLLVSGVVVDDLGRPVARADITPATKQVWDESQPDAFWWNELWANRGASDEQGHFEIRGRVATSEIGVWATKQSLKGTVVIVAPGASHVVLRLAATGAISGVVLLDPSVPREGLGVQVERTDEVNDPSDFWSPPAQLDEAGAFSVEGLRAGEYTVRLMNTLGWEALEEVAGVAVAPGASARDPRLDPLDLRGSLRAFRLEIVDEEDRAIEQGYLAVRRRSAADAAPALVMFQNGRAVLFHDGTGVDVTIASDGYRDVALAAATADQKVVLRRGVDVRLVLAQGLRVPDPPLYLCATLEPLEPAMSGGGPHWTAEEPTFDAHGVQRTVSPNVGRLRVTLTLTLRDESSWSATQLDAATERIIEVAESAGAQTFEISFDPAELERAVAEVGGGR